MTESMKHVLVPIDFSKNSEVAMNMAGKLKHVNKSKILDNLSIFSISGYAIPGIILAVAFITFVSWFDNNIINLFDF